VQSVSDYLQVAEQVTGAQVELSRSPTPVGSALPANEVSLPAAAFPSGAIAIELSAPASAISCSSSSAQTRVQTLGRVGERIYEEELHGASVAQTQRKLESSSTFQRAVAARNANATWTAIVDFFREHIHVVRVRVTVDGRLLIDVGGPYVLAPVHATLRSDGRVVGQFTWAIQDDAGYLKLARLFTGAQVLMRVAGHQVQGTLSPGPAMVPTRGDVSYDGRTYSAYSFTAEAFPSGPLQISLLF
jgi:hypothetical protein